MLYMYFFVLNSVALLYIIFLKKLLYHLYYELCLFQRNDIAMAITKFDQFDFLIDIVPRDDLKPPKRQVRKRRAVS